MQITKEYPEALETVSSSFFGLFIETQTQQAPWIFLFISSLRSLQKRNHSISISASSKITLSSHFLPRSVPFWPLNFHPNLRSHPNGKPPLPSPTEPALSFGITSCFALIYDLPHYGTLDFPPSLPPTLSLSLFKFSISTHKRSL